MENRNGLAVGGLITRASGLAEREAALALVDQRGGGRRITLGADKAYDVRKFIGDRRARGVIPHIAVDGHVRVSAEGAGTPRSSAVDARTKRHAGYALSQRSRKRIEEIFGWIEVSAGLSRVKLRGRARVDAAFRLALSAYTSSACPRRWEQLDEHAGPVAHHRDGGLGQGPPRSHGASPHRHRCACPGEFSFGCVKGAFSALGVEGSLISR